jgi:hypothetical protein
MISIDSGMLAFLYNSAVVSENVSGSIYRDSEYAQPVPQSDYELLADP